VDVIGNRRIKARLDFTGDFGDKTGILDILVNDAGLITAVDANLD
jgi:hypothetical protein